MAVPQEVQPGPNIVVRREARLYHIWEVLGSWPLEGYRDYSFHGLVQYFQTDAETVPRLVRNRFLPNHFIIIHPSPDRPMVYRMSGDFYVISPGGDS